MADLDQDTVNTAIDAYAPQIKRRAKRADELSGQVGELGKQEAAGSEDLAKKIEGRAAAEKPLQDKITTKLSERPSAQAHEESIPSYARPKGNEKDMEQGMSALAVAAMLVGIASRQPFYGMANAMNGFMKGYMDADQKVVEESMKTYDKNLQAVKERNASKRRAVDAILKDYDNDLLGMQQQLKIVAAQYDDPILAQKVRVGSISDQRDIALKQLTAEGNAIDHLVRAKESMLYRNAMLNERIKKREAAAATGEAASGRALQIISEMENILQNSSGVTGVLGAGRRVAESVKSTLGGDEGMAHRYESLARELQNVLRQTETFHYKGRTLSKESADRDVMVRGLKFGDTGQISMDQLQHLRNMLTGQGASFDGGGTAAPLEGQDAPPVNGKGWKLNVDANGNKAYVSPDRKQFEPVPSGISGTRG